MNLNTDFRLSPDIIKEIITTSENLTLNDLPADFKLNQCIEHTLLKPQARDNDFINLAKQAVDNYFYGVCIPPSRIKLLSEILKGSKVKIITTIAFPLGYSAMLVKAAEAAYAQDDGADEVDMVINIGKLKESDLNYCFEDISAVKNILYPETKLKVILETGLLETEEIVQAGYIALLAGADYLKTSTGFSDSGVTVDNIKLLRSLIDFHRHKHKKTAGIKASGGIKTGEFAVQLIKAGADKLGCSSSLQIIKYNILQQ